MRAEIIKATLADIDELNKISVASKMYWNYPDEWIEKWMNDLTLSEKDFPEQEIYKVANENEIIGFCAIKENDNAYEIMHLWIKPQFIGKGYGEVLIHESMKKIVTKTKPVIAESDPNAEEFYAKQGFKKIGERESYPKGRFLPVMRKDF